MPPAAAASPPAPADKPEEGEPLPKNDDFFESKAFRFITVMLYMAGVSGMGMTLAMYYFFIWDSRMPPLPEFKHTHHIG